MHTLKHILPIALIGFSSLTLGGCKSEQKQTMEVGLAESIEQTQPSISSNLKSYRVVLDAHYEPFEYKNETGNVIGYDVELIEAIAKEEGFKVEILEDKFRNILPSLEEKKYDIAISALKLNDSRRSNFLVSEPYFRTHEGFVVKESSSLQTVDDILGKTVTVLGDSHQHEKLELSNDTKIVSKPTIFLAYKELLMDNADAVYSEEPILHFEAKHFHEHPVRFINSDTRDNHYVIYTNKDNEELMSKINNGLDKLKTNGKYRELTQKWFGELTSDVVTL